MTRGLACRWLDRYPGRADLDHETPRHRAGRLRVCPYAGRVFSEHAQQAFETLIDTLISDAGGDPRPADESEAALRAWFALRLSALAALRGEVEQRMDAEGAAAILAGMSYTQAGGAVGLSKQRAWQRFSPVAIAADLG